MQLKNAGLAESLGLLREKSQKLPAYLVNKACFSIALRAARNMPVVTAEEIAGELNAAKATQLVKIKSGKRWSRAKKNQRFFFGPVGKGARPTVPLAALIIQAQVNPNSNFNLRTGNFYQRAMSPFKGKSRAAGAQAMLDAMRRLLSARRSSGGFYKLCALVVQQLFRPAIDSNPLRALVAQTGMEALPSGGNVSSKIGKLAGGTVASGIRDNARASFWVTATNPDTKGKPGGSLFTIAQPVWQQSVDDEAESIRDYATNGYSAAVKESGLKVA